jgi:hypothetical protein
MLLFYMIFKGANMADLVESSRLRIEKLVAVFHILRDIFKLCMILKINLKK